MRNLSICLILSLSMFAFSCDNKGAGDMATLQDSIAYTIGTEQIAKPFQELGLDLNPEAFIAGFRAGSSGEELMFDEQTMAQLYMQLQMTVQEAQMRTNVEDGQSAPDLTMATPGGEEMSISDLRGQYVLVDFWASWCRPCRQENPNVVRMYNKYKDQGFEILGVSLDDNRQKWLEAIEQDGLTWKHMSDLKQWESESVGIYGFKGIPYTVLLDPDGNIIAQHLRGQPLEAKLQEIFGI